MHIKFSNLKLCDKITERILQAYTVPYFLLESNTESKKTSKKTLGLCLY